jgi:hypothetical protein
MPPPFFKRIFSIHKAFMVDTMNIKTKILALLILFLPILGSACNRNRLVPIANYDDRSVLSFDGIIITNDIGLVQTTFGGLLTFDIEAITNFEPLASFPTTGGNYVNLIARGNYLYITQPDLGIRILDISNPNQLTEVGTYLQEDALGLLRADTILLLYSNDAVEQITTIDIAEPANPKRLSVTRNAGFPLGVSQNILFTKIERYIDGFLESTVRIYEVVEGGRKLKFISEIAISDAEEFNDLAFWNETGYLVSEEGLHILDVSNPQDIQQIGEYDLDFSDKVIIDYPIVYLTFLEGIRVLDVSNPSNPVVLAGVNDLSGVTGIAKVGSRIFVTTDGGLYVYEFSR